MMSADQLDLSIRYAQARAYVDSITPGTGSREWAEAYLRYWRGTGAPEPTGGRLRSVNDRLLAILRGES